MVERTYHGTPREARLGRPLRSLGGPGQRNLGPGAPGGLPAMLAKGVKKGNWDRRGGEVGHATGLGRRKN